jgi:hypothetical protein
MGLRSAYRLMTHDHRFRRALHCKTNRDKTEFLWVNNTVALKVHMAFSALLMC